jgi:hypothetical protein
VAKKKGDTGRARASRKKAAKKKVKRQAEQKVAGVEVAAESGAVESPEADNRTIRDGAELQRLVTQAIADFWAAQREERTSDRAQMGRIEVALTAMDQRLGVLANRLGETAAAPPTAPEAATTASTPAARLASDTRGAAVHAWRQLLWISETNQSRPLPKPRPTIVGRALSDLGATSRDCDTVTIMQIFQQIHASGQHHLDQGAVSNLDSAASDEQSERNRATSGLTKLFEARFKRLKKAQLAYENADRRWLTATGRDVFNGWPGWRVEHDDEECDGDERRARRRSGTTDESVAVASEALPAASAEGGGGASAASE